MSTDPLTAAVSARICTHMNDDHTDAVAAYAKHYGGVASPQNARMLHIESESMMLEVDGKTIRIPFDHKLTDSEDAHRTLVSMLRSMPKSVG